MVVALSILTYVVVMVLIGLYVSRKVKNSEDYVLAGRSLPFYMALATVFATWFGSESILGASTKFAEGGFGNVIEDPFGAALCLIIAGLFFNRKLYKLNFLTIGDYFKNRYNTIISVFLSIAIIISYFGWVAAQFLALGLVLSMVLPALSLQWAILFAAALVTLYTFFGGMYSVATLDTIQTFVITIGLGTILAYALSKIGGVDAFISQTPTEFWKVIPDSSQSLTEWAIFVTALMTIGFGSIPQQDVYLRLGIRSRRVALFLHRSHTSFHSRHCAHPVSGCFGKQSAEPRPYPCERPYSNHHTGTILWRARICYYLYGFRRSSCSRNPPC
jgi:Na+/proline symporter